MSTGIQLRQISSHVKMVRLSITQTEGYNLSTTLPFSIIFFFDSGFFGRSWGGWHGAGPVITAVELISRRCELREIRTCLAGRCPRPPCRYVDRYLCALMLNISNIDLDPNSSPHLKVQRLQTEKTTRSHHSSAMPALGLSSAAVTLNNGFTV